MKDTEEFRVSGSNKGYRRVWAHLQKTEIKVLQKDICRTILHYDPDGVLKRKQRKLRRTKYFNQDQTILDI